MPLGKPRLICEMVLMNLEDTELVLLRLACFSGVQVGRKKKKSRHWACEDWLASMECR
jgi:hypothetical protein